MLGKKDATLNLQKKQADLLKIKWDIKIIKWKTDVDNFLILDLPKKCVKLMKDFLTGTKRKW